METMEWGATTAWNGISWNDLMIMTSVIASNLSISKPAVDSFITDDNERAKHLAPAESFPS